MKKPDINPGDIMSINAPVLTWTANPSVEGVSALDICHRLDKNVIVLIVCVPEQKVTLPRYVYILSNHGLSWIIVDRIESLTT